MNTPTTRLIGSVAAVWVALALLAVPGAAAAAIIYTRESLPEFEHQLDSGQIASATFNKRIRSLRLTLKNGQHVVVMYPRHQESATAAKLQAKHVTVTVLSKGQATQEVPKKAVHHKLRYIALGVLVVLIVVVVLVLRMRRKRQQD
jgi:hypothetical protein